LNQNIAESRASNETFSSRELLARLRAVIRRSGWAAETTKGKPLHEVVAGPLRICLETHTATLDDKPLVLTVSEFDLLVARVRNKGRARENLRTVLPPGGGTKALDGWRRSGAGNRAPLRRSMRGRGFS
jgi:hypothetical protein